jgi:hypothetical protein
MALQQQADIILFQSIEHSESGRGGEYPCRGIPSPTRMDNRRLYHGLSRHAYCVHCIMCRRSTLVMEGSHDTNFCPCSAAVWRRFCKSHPAPWQVRETRRPTTAARKYTPHWTVRHTSLVFSNGKFQRRLKAGRSLERRRNAPAAEGAA